MTPQPPSLGAKVSPASILTAVRPPVARYRRWIIAGLIGLVLLAIGGALIIAFSPARHRSISEPEPPALAPSSASEVEKRLPARYDDPLAIKSQAPAADLETAPLEGAGPAAAPGANARAPELGRGQEAAAASQPFFSAPARPPEKAGVAAANDQSESSSPALAPQTQKEAFISIARQARSAAASLALPPLSPFEVKRGAVIPAALVTGLNSDLPGMVIAQVTEPVFDHATGQHLLIAQGSRLVGRYDSQVSYGQDRLLMVWTELILPDGRSIDLGAMAGADASGAGGLADEVDLHEGALARGMGLSTLVSIGAAAAQNALARSADNLILQDASGGLAAGASQIGQRLVDRDLGRAPTLRVRPGWPLRIIVEHDLILAPADGG